MCIYLIKIFRIFNNQRNIMPKLLYFNLQGRAQAIRYMLKHKGVEFEDERLTKEQWSALKEEGKYGGESAQLPIWEVDENTHMNQSMSILKYLAHEHNCMPTTAQEMYEAEWYLAYTADAMTKPGMI